jgi:hypothetical protein
MAARTVQLLKYVEWQDAGGNWLCNDTSDLCSPRALWWAPARMLNISPAEYVQLLINQFHPDRIKYFQDTDTLVYSWKNINDMRRFKNWLNAQARKYQFII